MKILITLLFWLLPTVAQAQVTYLATYEAHPTEAGVTYAHSNIRGTECVRLAPNLAFCNGPSLPGRAGILSLDPDATLTAGQKTFLANRLGRAITETTVKEAITALIDANAIPLKRWRDGKQHLWVKGRDVWNRPAPLATYIPSVRDVLLAPVAFVEWLVTPTLAWATSLSESFTATDGVIHGCNARGCTYNWNHFQGATLNIVSNRAAREGSVGIQLARPQSALATDDMKAGLTLSDMTISSATNLGAGPIFRKETGNGTQTYLYCTAHVSSTSDFVAFGERVAAAGSDTGTATVAVSNGDVIEGAVLNDSVVCLLNGVRVLGPTTMTTGAGFTEAGIRMSGAGTATSTVTAIDGWYAEDITILPGGGGRRAIAPMVLQ